MDVILRKREGVYIRACLEKVKTHIYKIKKIKNSTGLIPEITKLSIFLEQTMSGHTQDNQNQANTNTISQQEYSFRIIKCLILVILAMITHSLV